MAGNPKDKEKELEEKESPFVELSNSLTQIFKDYYDSQVKLTSEHKTLTEDISSLDKNYEGLSKEFTKLSKDVLDSLKELKKLTDAGAKTSAEQLKSESESLRGEINELGKTLDETNKNSLQALEVNKEELIQNIGILKEFISSNIDTVVTEATNTKEQVQEQVNALPNKVEEILQQMREDVSTRFEKVEKDVAQAMDSLNERVDSSIKDLQELLLEKIKENEGKTTELHNELTTILAQMNETTNETLGTISSEVEKLKIAYFDKVVTEFDTLSKRIDALESAINELNKRDTMPPTEILSRLEEIERTILPRSDFESKFGDLTKDLSKQLSAIKIAMIRVFPEIEGKKEGAAVELIEDPGEEEEEGEVEGEESEEETNKAGRGRSRKTS
ncbi:MAG: hypothetical protein ACFFCD_02280 [Promethearchaeota archaeon]